MNRSRQVLLTSASVLALSLASSGGAVADGYEPVGKGFVAQAPMRTTSGTGAIYGSRSWIDFDDNDGNENPWNIGGDARIDIPLSNTVSVQVDGYGDVTFRDDLTTSNDYTGGYLGGLHLNVRAPNRYLFGVFGGGGRLHFASTEDDRYTHWLAGVEGQYYNSNTAFYGQVGYADSQSNDPTSNNVLMDAYFLRGVVRHYLNAGNTKLEGELGWMSGENDKGEPFAVTDDVDMIMWGVEVEHVVRSWGNDGFLSFFARYQGQDVDEDDQSTGDEGSAHTVKVGIRMDLNQLNPFTRERTGAAVDLPDMNRWLGYSRIVD